MNYVPTLTHEMQKFRAKNWHRVKQIRDLRAKMTEQELEEEKIRILAEIDLKLREIASKLQENETEK